MRWVRIETADGPCYGIVEGESIATVRGSPFGDHAPTGERVALDTARFLPPVAPPTFYAAGLNYPEHAVAAANKRGVAPSLPENADIGYRAVNSLTGHNCPIVIPADATERVQYEAELVAVIGRAARNIREDRVRDHLLGYTIGNDVSERHWQAHDRTLWRAKNTDSFAPMGPWIDTGFDPAGTETTVRLNGEKTIRFATDSMIFSVETFIARMSRYLTLVPGDVVWMGTEGVGPNLAHGDLCEIEIAGLGTLSNPVVREGL